MACGVLLKSDHNISMQLRICVDSVNRQHRYASVIVILKLAVHFSKKYTLSKYPGLQDRAEKLLSLALGVAILSLSLALALTLACSGITL